MLYTALLVHTRFRRARSTMISHCFDELPGRMVPDEIFNPNRIFSSPVRVLRRCRGNVDGFMFVEQIVKLGHAEHAVGAPEKAMDRVGKLVLNLCHIASQLQRLEYACSFPLTHCPLRGRFLRRRIKR
jgi:hypothetical protein